MNRLCLRCRTRERAPGLLCCEACVNGLVRSEQSQEPVLRVPEPMSPFVRAAREKRLPVRVDWGRAAA